MCSDDDNKRTVSHFIRIIDQSIKNVILALVSSFQIFLYVSFENMLIYLGILHKTVDTRKVFQIVHPPIYISIRSCKFAEMN